MAQRSWGYGAVGLALAWVLGACGDDSSANAGGGRDASARADAAVDAATTDAQAGWQPGDAGWTPDPALGDCFDIGEPFEPPFCVGDYCLEQPSLPLTRPLALDGSSERDVWMLLPGMRLLHRGCSGWTVVPDAFEPDMRCVSLQDHERCVDDDGENCGPVCELVVTGPDSVWLDAHGLWRFDGARFRRWTEAPEVADLVKVGQDLWLVHYAEPWNVYRFESNAFALRTGRAIGALESPPQLFGLGGDNVWALGFPTGVARWDGADWHALSAQPTPNTQALAVFGQNDVWASGGDFIERWTGSAWEQTEHRGRAMAVREGEVWVYRDAWNGMRYEWSGERYVGTEVRSVEFPETTDELRTFGGAMWLSDARGDLLRYADDDWQPVLGDAADDLVGIPWQLTGQGDDLWVAAHDGQQTLFLRRGASRFERVHAERGSYTLYPRARDDVWAFGERDGTARVLRWDGVSWEAVSPSPPGMMIAMWSDGTTVLGLSPTQLRSYDTPTWNVVFEWPPSVSASGMFVTSPDDIWLAGGRLVDEVSGEYAPWIAHYNGSEWLELDAPPNTPIVRQISGTGPGDVWIATDAGPLRWDGGAWTPMSTDATEPLFSLLPAGEGNLLLCYQGRVRLWNGAEVEDVAITPLDCPAYAPSPVDFWSTVQRLEGTTDPYYGIWRAQLR